MTYATLITTAELARNLARPDWVIFDCRFTLADRERGRRDYLHNHISGAIYAHLNDDLSGPIVSGQTGRHPLPTVEVISRFFSRTGVDSTIQVIAYDDAGGAMAARLWWLLRWLGHDAVAILDGGWQKWTQADGPTTATIPTPTPRVFVPQSRSDDWLTSDQVLAQIGDSNFKLLDSRNADRYRGENETIDPIAGHIPGAISAPYADNLNPDGTFKPIEQLRARFESLLGDTSAEHAAFYCGSGVTAAHNILAAKHAGLGEAKLYAGSWSEWITDARRPIKTGTK
ncbi:MAG: sulfurtransferase [Anaerolineae bacterium]